ncbi:MAG: hypothetical protein L3J41_14120 [Melioribacteraceae bacterium]|nr:hypothetical protein [Melioribacteraceae bacterium]
MNLKNVTLLLTLISSLFFIQCTSSDREHTYYVNPIKGNDLNTGSVAAPFKSLHKALAVVNDRVKSGALSDKIILRGGVYKSTKTSTIYNLNLKGTPDNYTIISAMPCPPNSENGVKRKSGQWYEKVVFDDGYLIKSEWTQLDENPLIWKTNPGYTLQEWTSQNLWPWKTKNNMVKTFDDSSETALFTVAPYMLLQDDEPTIWAEKITEMVNPGMRTYNHNTGTLFLRPFGEKDPNDSKIETWYGGPEENEKGTLLLDGEGRALFDGDLEYVTIRGFEFRMFTRLFELHRRGYKKESERVRQNYVRFEDNLTRYGWINILLDANTIYDEDEPNFIKPRFEDRSHWEARNNEFYRPSREVFQVHGDNHIFEYNEIIDHNGPWAGPAACVSAVNVRNSRNMKIRYNYIHGQGNTLWNPGSVFMIEVNGDQHVDKNGDYIYSGLLYEHNIFADITSGPVMFLGKGNTRMRNITIRNNVFFNSQNDPTILITSPHQNLNIVNNIFYNLAKPIEVRDGDGTMKKPFLPSSIYIRDNIFVNNEKLIDDDIFNYTPGSEVIVDRNLFYQNESEGIGTNIIIGNPLFNNPENLDFRYQSGSPAIIPGHDIGAYDIDSPISHNVKWWLINNSKIENRITVNEKL